jgi:error-prone DNA polymerase
VREVLSRTLGVPIFQEQAMQIAIAAAGFTPGEADQLRRAMAAWKSARAAWSLSATSLLGGHEAAAVMPTNLPKRCTRQIQGFGEYGFPESHAASFALLVYVSAWLKRHEPAAFLLGLLNAQPMGFYSPAQLVQDARRHGVEVRPVDVTVSAAESTLEGDGPVAVRLGLDRVRNLAAAAGARIVAARAATPFADLADLARRAELGRGELDIAGRRRRPVAARRAPASGGLGRRRGAAAARPVRRRRVARGRRHPCRAARGRGDRRRLPQPGPHARPPSAGPVARAAGGAALSSGPWSCAARGDRAVVRCAGLVTCRQRPGTASGVIFVTLEDETGCANVVVFNELACRQRRLLLGSRLLGVAGQLQVEGAGEHAVVHLVAQRLFDHSELLGSLVMASRDFH